MSYGRILPKMMKNCWLFGIVAVFFALSSGLRGQDVVPEEKSSEKPAAEKAEAGDPGTEGKPSPAEPAPTPIEKDGDVSEKPEPSAGEKEVRKRISQMKKALDESETPEEDAHLEEKKIARAFLALEDYEGAITHMKNSIALQEKAPLQEYLALGQLMLSTEKYQPCIKLLREAEKIYPDSLDLSVMLTAPLMALEKWKPAARQYAKIQKKFESTAEKGEGLNSNFFFQYATVVERMGDIDKAAQLLLTCLERIPEDPEQDMFRAQALNYLGYMWLENDMKIDEAGALVLKAAKLDPDSGAIADSVGWYYFKKERYIEAMNELVKAEAMMEEPDPVVMDHIAQTYYKIGNKDQAVSYMERALELDPENEEFQKRLELYASN